MRADVAVCPIQYLDWRLVTYPYRNDHESGAEALEWMSEQMRGRCVRDSEQLRLSHVFQQIEGEMRGTYSIGYAPERGLGEPLERKIKLASPRMEVKKMHTRDGCCPDAIGSPSP